MPREARPAGLGQVFYNPASQGIPAKVPGHEGFSVFPQPRFSRLVRGGIGPQPRDVRHCSETVLMVTAGGGAPGVRWVEAGLLLTPPVHRSPYDQHWPGGLGRAQLLDSGHQFPQFPGGTEATGGDHMLKVTAQSALYFIYYVFPQLSQQQDT